MKKSKSGKRVMRNLTAVALQYRRGLNRDYYPTICLVALDHYDVKSGNTLYKSTRF